MTFSALVGLLLGHLLLSGTALPLPATIAAIGVAALLIFRATARVRAAKA